MNRASLVRTALWLVLGSALGYSMLAAFGWFDTPIQRAESEARKCGSARKINVLADAERYCAKALDILRTEKVVPDIAVARVHLEVAALAMLQKRFDDAARHCEIVLAAWRKTREEESRSPNERAQSIEACEKVISAVSALRQRK
jgi:hypothetical protein